MAVDEPRDVLAELLDLAGSYCGPTPWSPNAQGLTSNPVKLRADYVPEEVFAHPKPRIALSAREGTALLYALRSRRPEITAGTVFSRTFRHRDGRELVLEDGVMRDLLAVGVISHSASSEDQEFVVTGLGRTEIARCFPGYVS